MLTEVVGRNGDLETLPLNDGIGIPIGIFYRADTSFFMENKRQHTGGVCSKSKRTTTPPFLLSLKVRASLDPQFLLHPVLSCHLLNESQTFQQEVSV